MIKVLEFSDALNIAGEKGKHLLLGNGFSIAWKKDIFSYDSLFQKADFKKVSPNVKKVFSSLKTTDFEKVIFALKYSSIVLSIYNSKDEKTRILIEDDARKLKEILIKAISDNHPESPNSVILSEYDNCSKFLNNFEHIYTLNYDLLLYWVIMHSGSSKKYDDGFRKPVDLENPSYVTWEVEKTSTQNVYYLHGALHIFDAGSEIQKYTWINTGIKLIDQIREAIETDKYPLIVSEGSADEKKEKIQHSGYLNRGYRSLRSIGNSLFIYGWSFSDNDNHILKILRNTHLKNIFVSLHGDINSEKNKRIIKICENTFGKIERFKLYYYSSDSVKIWR